MRARPRLRAPGLRGRIVGLVLFTTVATLAVAAAALLGPLESSLRHAAQKTLEQELRSYRAGPAFAKFNPSLALQASRNRAVSGATKTQRRLHNQGVDEQRTLETPLARIGSKVGAAEASLVQPYPYSSGVGRHRDLAVRFGPLARRLLRRCHVRLQHSSCGVQLRHDRRHGVRAGGAALPRRLVGIRGCSRSASPSTRSLPP